MDCYENYFEMKKELEEYRQKGIKISMEGKNILPRHMAQRCCLEKNSDYMRDYVIDDNGKLIEIGFNRISRY